MFVRSPSAYLRSCNSPWEAIKKVTDNYQHLTTVNKVSIFSGITLGPLGIYYIAGIRAALVGGFALLGLVVIVIKKNNPQPSSSHPTANKVGTVVQTPPNPANPYPRPFPPTVAIRAIPVPEPEVSLEQDNNQVEISFPEMNNGDNKKVCVLHELPAEIIQTILLNLDLKDISACSLVCKKWNVAATHDNLWYRLRARDFPFHPPIKNSPLKPCDIYKSDYKSRSNLIKGMYTSTFFPSQFPDVTILVRIIADGKIFLGSDRGTIEIINIKTNESLGLLSREGSRVTSLAVVNNMLFSGYSDGAIHVWDLNEGKCTNTLIGHSEKVTSLVIYQGKSETDSTQLISGSEDTTIKIWDPMGKECLSTLIGHEKKINTLVVYEDQLFSCAFDDKIKIWNLMNPTTECLHTLPGSEFVVFEEQLFSINKKSIDIWNPKTGEHSGVLNEHYRLIYHLFILDGMLFSIDYDKTKVWDVKTRNCLHTINNYSLKTVKTFESITLVFADEKLFLAPRLNGVDVFDFKADQREIFAEIASTYRKLPGVENDDWREAYSRFDRMPESEKDKIIKEYECLKRKDSSMYENELIAQAIENYLQREQFTPVS